MNQKKKSKMKIFKLKGKVVLEEISSKSYIEKSEIDGGYFISKKYDDNLSVMENIKNGNGLKSLEKEEQNGKILL